MENLDLYCREEGDEGYVEENCENEPVRLERIPVVRAAEEKNLLNDNRTLVNMLQTEENYLPSPSCFVFQKEITALMRRTIATWLIEIGEEQNLEEDVITLSMNYFDRFISCHKIDKSNLQLVASVCLFIASKLKECRPLEAEQLVAYTDFSIQVQDLLRWEMLVLQTLKWDICAVTAHDYLYHLTSRLNIEPNHLPQIIRHAQTFITLCATEFSFAIQPASVLACASICTAVSGLTPKPWSEKSKLYQQLHDITCIEIEHIRTCHEQIEQLLTQQFKEASKDDHSYSTNPNLSLNISSHQKSCPSSTTPTDVVDITLIM